VPDVFSKAKRSQVMSCIRARGNRDTELAMILFFRERGFIGWRRHSAIRGRPDFVFRKYKVAVFVDGCFWHGCPLHFRIPTQNRPYWTHKLNANQARDRSVTRQLRSRGWRVMRVWEHELAPSNAPRLARRFAAALSVGATEPATPAQESQRA